MAATNKCLALPELRDMGCKSSRGERDRLVLQSRVREWRFIFWPRLVHFVSDMQDDVRARAVF